MTINAALELSTQHLAFEEADQYEKIEGDEHDLLCYAYAVRDLHNANGELRAAHADLNRQLSEAHSDLCFWKRAAEQAIAGWNQLEDSIEATHEALDAIESNVGAARHLLNNDAPPAPEAPKLHVVPDAPPATE